MADDKEVIERLESYAKVIARKLLLRYDLGHDEAWHEDISQSLLLAGWQVWRDTADEGKAKHRMSSRAVNEEKKLNHVLRQGHPLSSFDLPEPSSDRLGGADATEDYHAEGALEFRPLRQGSAPRASPLEDMIVQEYLGGLPERQRRILRLRMAMMTVPEIAKELGIGTRTVERELEQIRKDYTDEHEE